MSDKQQLEISFATPLRIVLAQEESKPGYRAIFTYQIGEFIFKGENMANTMAAGSIATLSVQWVDKGGNPAKVDGPTKWQSSDDTILKVEVSTGNPLISNVYSQGPIGAAQVQATADADLGSGVQNITAVCDITVIAGQAYAGQIQFTQYPQQNPGGPNRPAKK